MHCRKKDQSGRVSRFFAARVPVFTVGDRGGLTNINDHKPAGFYISNWQLAWLPA
jgi:hypothetical protein